MVDFFFFLLEIVYIMSINFLLNINFPGDKVVKNGLSMQEMQEMRGPIPGLGRSPEVGNGNLLQNPCLKNPRDRGAW